MRKIDGLKFLQKNFPDLTVDCLFVDKVENLDEQELEKSNLWRVRGGRTIGSELNLPQGTFSDKKELKQFMKEQKQKRWLRIGCLVLAGVFALSLLGSVVMMLLY